MDLHYGTLIFLQKVEGFSQCERQHMVTAGVARHFTANSLPCSQTTCANIRLGKQ